MTSIQIYNPQGYAYEANWNGGVLFPITDSCERIANVMGEDCVRLVFKLPNKVVFDAFAYIVYNGQTFFLKEQYIPTPDGTFKEDNGEISTAYFSYDVKFVSVGNMLDKFICYRHVKVTNAGEWDEPEININGNLETLYVIIMGSIQQASNRLKAQYGQLYFADLLDTIVANGLDGNMPNTENVKLTANTNLLTFNFSGDNIANVCTTVANSFTNDDKKDTEWYIVENNGSLTLHFAKCVDVEYGVQYVSDYISNNNSADSSVRPQKSGGLKKVEYSQAWSGITNVIVPYGSTRNMSYQAAKGIDEITQMQSTFGKRLRLTPNTSYNVKDKEGNEVIITTDSHGAIRNNYVDTGIEQVKFYDEIYPQGHFRVTSVETKNKRQDGEIVPEYTVSGIAIDSKGNEIQPAEGFYPIVIEEGTTLSVRFEKGLLNGREFEIANKTRKDEGATTYSLKFTIVADGSIEDGTLIPSGNFIPREGDEFALFNMKMPEVYITAAQQELAQRAYDELVELQTSRPQVKCTTDPTAWDKPIALGYQFKVMSELFNSEDSFISRVTSYSYKLTKPYDVQFTLASAIMQGTLSQMNDLISDVTHQAGGLEQRAINLSRRGWRDAAEMAEMVDSLAADMMLVGNEKYQFAFTAGIEIVNSNNQTTAIKIGEGTLQHTQDPYISDYTCQGWWSHGAVTLNNGHTENGSASLVSLPDTPFYLYAVVGQNSTDISFELQDKEQDGEAYLLLGILSSAFADNGTNYRVFNRTNGYTQMSGGTITTEQIQDAGRNLIIDFQHNPPRIIARNGAEIIGNIKFLSAVDENGNDVLKTLESLGFDVSGLQNDVNNVKYVDISNATNISLTIRSQVMTLADVAVKLASSRYKMKFQKGSETALSPFSTSCIAIVEKGQNVSHSTVIDLVKWGEEYTPTTEVDAYFLPADKEYFIEYAFPNLYDHIEYDMKEVWTTNNVQVLVESGDYLKMLQAEMSAKEESTMEAIAGLKDIQDSLQSQIDGEVTSWFYDKAPVDTSDNVLTDIEPMSEWLKNYTFANGVYTLKSGERNELVNHIGDTYTNMEEYKVDDQGNTTTPLAGLSWRWCDATTVNPLPSKYITIRYTQNGIVVEKRLHWHKIADSDAVKALREAGKAQATADGKSTIYSLTGTNRPTNYQKGDMWILQSDTIHPGGKKGDILNANQDSATYAESHWTKEVSYIDEEVAAQKAQEALDDLELGGTNLLTGSRTGEGWSQYTSFADGVYYSENNTSGEKSIYSPKNLKLTKGTYTLSFDFKTDGFKKYSGTGNEGIQLFFLDGDFSPMNHHRIQYADISTNWKHYIWTFEVEEDCSGDAYIRFDNDRTSSYTNPTKLWVKDIKLEKGNKATGWSPAPEDVDSKADAIKAMAEEAIEDAAESNTQLANMSNDSILTPQEKGSVADEWACIQKEHTQNSTNKTAAWGSATVAEWTAYNNAYTTLQTYVGTLALTDRATNTTINKSTFQTNFANYYSANVAFLNALSKKVAELEVAAMEIGGRNLLRDTKERILTATSSNTYVINTPTSGLKPNTDYVFSIDKCEILAGGNFNAFTVYIFSGDIQTARNRIDVPISSSRQTVKFTTTSSVEDSDVVLIYVGLWNNTAGKAIKLTNIKLEQGTKATAWTPAPEDVDAKVSALDYLKKALELDTDVAGGIVATTHIQLRDWTGEYNSDGTKKYKVNAGLSGLDDDNVLAWGGADYEDAVEAAKNSDPESGNGTYNKKDGTEITTLIKKDGTGKIGAFWIDKDTVKVVSGEQTTFITNKSISDVVSKQSTREISKATKSYSSSTNKTEGSTTSYNTIYSKSFSVTKGKYALRGNLSVDELEAYVVGTSTPYTNDLVYAQAYVGGLRIRVVQNGVTKATLTGSCTANDKWYGYANSSYPNGQLKQEKTGSITSGKIEDSVSGEFELSAGTAYIYIEAIYYGRANLDGKSGNVSYVLQFSYDAKLLGLDKYSVIAKDGIGIIANSDAQFYVENSDSSRYLRVIANGLPVVTSQTMLNSLSKGQLYIEGGSLKIKT